MLYDQRRMFIESADRCKVFAYTLRIEVSPSLPLPGSIKYKLLAYLRPVARTTAPFRQTTFKAYVTVKWITYDRGRKRCCVELAHLRNVLLEDGIRPRAIPDRHVQQAQNELAVVKLQSFFFTDITSEV